MQWPHRSDDNGLFLAYELILRDPEATVRRIARFIGVDADDGLIALTLDQSSIESMSGSTCSGVRAEAIGATMVG